MSSAKNRVDEIKFTQAFEAIYPAHEPSLNDNDSKFLKRVFGEGLDKYTRRLSKLGLVGKEHVLDAGCGFGQWSLAMAQNENHHITSCDLSAERTSFLQDMTSHLNIENVDTRVCKLEELPFEPGKFSFVFSYSVLYMTDIDLSLREITRVLKPGGQLYLCTNGLGWYLYNLISPHKPARDYDPRKMAADAIENTLNHLSGDSRIEGRQLIRSSKQLVQSLESLGYCRIVSGPEGTLRETEESCKPNFDADFLGFESVYEVLATKKG